MQAGTLAGFRECNPGNLAVPRNATREMSWFHGMQLGKHAGRSREASRLAIQEASQATRAQAARTQAARVLSARTQAVRARPGVRAASRAILLPPRGAPAASLGRPEAAVLLLRGARAGRPSETAGAHSQCANLAEYVTSRKMPVDAPAKSALQKSKNPTSSLEFPDFPSGRLRKLEMGISFFRPPLAARRPWAANGG